MDLSVGRQGLVLRVEMDVVTGVELECSYGAGDGRTRSGVATGKSMDMTGPRSLALLLALYHPQEQPVRTSRHLI